MAASNPKLNKHVFENRLQNKSIFFEMSKQRSPKKNDFGKATSQPGMLRSFENKVSMARSGVKILAGLNGRGTLLSSLEGFQ